MQLLAKELKISPDLFNREIGQFHEERVRQNWNTRNFAENFSELENGILHLNLDYLNLDKKASSVRHNVRHSIQTIKGVITYLDAVDAGSFPHSMQTVRNQMRQILLSLLPAHATGLNTTQREAITGAFRDEIQAIINGGLDGQLSRLALPESIQQHAAHLTADHQQILESVWQLGFLDYDFQQEADVTAFKARAETVKEQLLPMINEPDLKERFSKQFDVYISNVIAGVPNEMATNLTQVLDMFTTSVNSSVFQEMDNMLAYDEHNPVQSREVRHQAVAWLINRMETMKGKNPFASLYVANLLKVAMRAIDIKLLSKQLGGRFDNAILEDGDRDYLANTELSRSLLEELGLDAVITQVERNNTGKLVAKLLHPARGGMTKELDHSELDVFIRQNAKGIHEVEAMTHSAARQVKLAQFIQGIYSGNPFVPPGMTAEMAEPFMENIATRLLRKVGSTTLSRVTLDYLATVMGLSLQEAAGLMEQLRQAGFIDRLGYVTEAFSEQLPADEIPEWLEDVWQPVSSAFADIQAMASKQAFAQVLKWLDSEVSATILVRLFTDITGNMDEFNSLMETFGMIPHRDKQVDILGKIAELFESQIVIGSLNPEESGLVKAKIFEAIISRHPQLEESALRQVVHPLKPKLLASLTKGSATEAGMYERALAVMPRHLLDVRTEDTPDAQEKLKIHQLKTDLDVIRSAISLTADAPPHERAQTVKDAQTVTQQLMALRIFGDERAITVAMDNLRALASNPPAIGRLAHIAVLNPILTNMQTIAESLEESQDQIQAIHLAQEAKDQTSSLPVRLAKTLEAAQLIRNLTANIGGRRYDLMQDVAAGLTNSIIIKNPALTVQDALSILFVAPHVSKDVLEKLNSDLKIPALVSAISNHMAAIGPFDSQMKRLSRIISQIRQLPGGVAHLRGFDETSIILDSGLTSLQSELQESHLSHHVVLTKLAALGQEMNGGQLGNAFIQIGRHNQAELLNAPRQLNKLEQAIYALPTTQDTHLNRVKRTVAGALINSHLARRKDNQVTAVIPTVIRLIQSIPTEDQDTFWGQFSVQKKALLVRDLAPLLHANSPDRNVAIQTLNQLMKRNPTELVQGLNSLAETKDATTLSHETWVADIAFIPEMQNVFDAMISMDQSGFADSQWAALYATAISQLPEGADPLGGISDRSRHRIIKYAKASDLGRFLAAASRTDGPYKELWIREVIRMRPQALDVALLPHDQIPAEWQSRLAERVSVIALREVAQQLRLPEEKRMPTLISAIGPAAVKAVLNYAFEHAPNEEVFMRLMRQTILDNPAGALQFLGAQSISDEHRVDILSRFNMNNESDVWLLSQVFSPKIVNIDALERLYDSLNKLPDATQRGTMTGLFLGQFTLRNADFLSRHFYHIRSSALRMGILNSLSVQWRRNKTREAWAMVPNAQKIRILAMTIGIRPAALDAVNSTNEIELWNTIRNYAFENAHDPMVLKHIQTQLITLLNGDTVSLFSATDNNTVRATFALQQATLLHDAHTEFQDKLTARQRFPMLFTKNENEIAQFVDYLNINHFSATSDTARLLLTMSRQLQKDINDIPEANRPYANAIRAMLAVRAYTIAQKIGYSNAISSLASHNPQSLSDALDTLAAQIDGIDPLFTDQEHRELIRLSGFPTPVDVALESGDSADAFPVLKAQVERIADDLQRFSSLNRFRLGDGYIPTADGPAMSHHQLGLKLPAYHRLARTMEQQLNSLARKDLQTISETHVTEHQGHLSSKQSVINNLETIRDQMGVAVAEGRLMALLNGRPMSLQQPITAGNANPLGMTTLIVDSASARNIKNGDTIQVESRVNGRLIKESKQAMMVDESSGQISVMGAFTNSFDQHAQVKVASWVDAQGRAHTTQDRWGHNGLATTINELAKQDLIEAQQFAMATIAFYRAAAHGNVPGLGTPEDALTRLGHLQAVSNFVHSIQTGELATFPFIQDEINRLSMDLQGTLEAVVGNLGHYTKENRERVMRTIRDLEAVSGPDVQRAVHDVLSSDQTSNNGVIHGMENLVILQGYAEELIAGGISDANHQLGLNSAVVEQDLDRFAKRLDQLFQEVPSAHHGILCGMIMSAVQGKLSAGNSQKVNPIGQIRSLLPKLALIADIAIRFPNHESELGLPSVKAFAKAALTQITNTRGQFPKDRHLLQPLARLMTHVNIALPSDVGTKEFSGLSADQKTLVGLQMQLGDQQFDELIQLVSVRNGNLADAMTLTQEFEKAQRFSFSHRVEESVMRRLTDETISKIQITQSAKRGDVTLTLATAEGLEPGNWISLSRQLNGAYRIVEIRGNRVTLNRPLTESVDAGSTIDPAATLVRRMIDDPVVQLSDFDTNPPLAISATDIWLNLKVSGVLDHEGRLVRGIDPENMAGIFPPELFPSAVAQAHALKHIKGVLESKTHLEGYHLSDFLKVRMITRLIKRKPETGFAVLGMLDKNSTLKHKVLASMSLDDQSMNDFLIVAMKNQQLDGVLAMVKDYLQRGESTVNYRHFLAGIPGVSEPDARQIVAALKEQLLLDDKGKVLDRFNPQIQITLNLPHHLRQYDKAIRTIITQVKEKEAIERDVDRYVLTYHKEKLRGSMSEHQMNVFATKAIYHITETFGQVPRMARFLDEVGGIQLLSLRNPTVVVSPAFNGMWQKVIRQYMYRYPTLHHNVSGEYLNRPDIGHHDFSKGKYHLDIVTDNILKWVDEETAAFEAYDARPKSQKTSGGLYGDIVRHERPLGIGEHDEGLTELQRRLTELEDGLQEDQIPRPEFEARNDHAYRFLMPLLTQPDVPSSAYTKIERFKLKTHYTRYMVQRHPRHLIHMIKRASEVEETKEKGRGMEYFRDMMLMINERLSHSHFIGGSNYLSENEADLQAERLKFMADIIEVSNRPVTPSLNSDFNAAVTIKRLSEDDKARALSCMMMDPHSQKPRPITSVVDDWFDAYDAARLKKDTRPMKNPQHVELKMVDAVNPFSATPYAHKVSETDFIVMLLTFENVMGTQNFQRFLRGQGYDDISSRALQRIGTLETESERKRLISAVAKLEAKIANAQASHFHPSPLCKWVNRK